MKKALITGSSGQDGVYLTNYLLQAGYIVLGIDKKISTITHPNFYPFYDLSILDFEQLINFLNFYKPEEVYHLATCHYATEDLPENDYKLFEESNNLHVRLTVVILDWILSSGLKSKFFYAASCHMFGLSKDKIQNEQSLFSPNCIYGITKYSGMKICEYFRTKYSVFVSVGILFHHESPFRSSKFVSKKIVSAISEIKKNNNFKLEIGNLSSLVDWGYAEDYVIAMYTIMQQDNPETFVISSGSLHSVEEFVIEAFGYVGLDWKNHVIENVNLIKKRDKSIYFGDSSKLKNLTGWQPNKTFKELVRLMVDWELNSYDQK